MKEFDDQKIQKLIEEQFMGEPMLSSTDPKDKEVYKQLFEILGEEPSLTIPLDFSGKVTARISVRQARAGDVRFYLFLLLICLLGFGIGFILLRLADREFSMQLAAVFMQYKFIWLSGLFLLFIVQYLDFTIKRPTIKI